MMATTLPADIPLEDERQPSDNELKAVTAGARRQFELEKEIEETEKKLKDLKENLRSLAEIELPQLMVEVGLRGLTLKNGWRLEIREKIRAAITKENAAAAHKWLEDNDEGDLIKREFSIKFSRDQEKDVKKFERDLAQRKKPLNTTIKRAVHPQTLQSWVNEVLAEGRVIPEQLFGVYRQKVTHLIAPKQELE